MSHLKLIYSGLSAFHYTSSLTLHSRLLHSQGPQLGLLIRKLGLEALACEVEILVGPSQLLSHLGDDTLHQVSGLGAIATRSLESIHLARMHHVSFLSFRQTGRSKHVHCVKTLLAWNGQ